MQHDRGGPERDYSKRGYEAVAYVREVDGVDEHHHQEYRQGIIYQWRASQLCLQSHCNHHNCSGQLQCELRSGAKRPRIVNNTKQRIKCTPCNQIARGRRSTSDQHAADDPYEYSQATQIGDGSHMLGNQGIRCGNEPRSVC